MEPFADPGDVQAIWRPLTDAEWQIVYTRIESASRLVRRKVLRATRVSLDTLIANGTVDAGSVKDLVVEMVLRVMTIPALVRQESVAVDDGSRSRTYAASVSERSGLYVTDVELTDLVGGAGARQRAFTIYPGPGPSWT